MLAGDFNAQEGESLHDTFLYQHELHSIYENPTCYENLNNLINIDLNLTNCLKSIFKTDTIFTILSDFHKLVLSVFKTTFTKPKPKEVVFKNYRKFNENNFNQDLHNQLSSEQPKDYASFEKIFFINLRKTCTSKKKLLRANHAPYVTKVLRKVVMGRSYLEKLYFKNRTRTS